ncbi:hypothetical protein B0H19DRAFT_660804 [Mycena capillaripes]|nr:hypothetical protein B0H19DRAFT_660804 [Mycena capillaripes]
MQGGRIAAARKALVVLLRALPHKNTPFPAHVLADYGGTEIRRALEHTFEYRARYRPTSVLLLTDGDAWDIDGVLDAVRQKVAEASKDAPLCVSVLGIGNAVSTAMCDGIARVGNGTAMYVTEQESSFAGKIARLLKAVRTPRISNLTVDWGRPLVEAVEIAEPEDDFELVEEVDVAKNKTLNVFDVDVDPTLLDETPVPPAPQIVLPAPAAVQQSPFKVRNLFPGSRVNIYVIRQGRAVPSAVTLRGSAPDGAQIVLPIPVTLSRLPSTSALHALAARKIVQDLEDGQHAIRAVDADLLARMVRAHIIRLGTYQIASTHTSFVAVDEAHTQERAQYVQEAESALEAEGLIFHPTTLSPSHGAGGDSRRRRLSWRTLTLTQIWSRSRQLVLSRMSQTSTTPAAPTTPLGHPWEGSWPTRTHPTMKMGLEYCITTTRQRCVSLACPASPRR